MSDPTQILSKLQAEESKGNLSPELIQLSGEFRTLLADFGRRIQEMTTSGVVPDYETMDAQQARLHELADQISAILVDKKLEQLPPILTVVASFRNSMQSQMVRMGKKRVLNPAHATDTSQPKFITIDAQVGLLSPVTNDQGVEIPDTHQYTDIEGNIWPISLEQVATVLTASLGTPEKQLWLERGFYELVFDPILAPIDTQADNLADHYLTRAQAGTLYRSDADGNQIEVIQDTDAMPVPAQGQFQMIGMTKEQYNNRKDNESGGESIDYSNLLYDQQGWEAEPNDATKPLKQNSQYVRKQGVPALTKLDLIQEAKSQKDAKQQGVIPGWRVYLVDRYSLTSFPYSMSQEELTGYQDNLGQGVWAPLPSGKSPYWYTEQLESMRHMKDAEGKPLYPGLTGMHVDLALSLASQVAQRDRLVMDDWEHAGKANYLTGNIFQESGLLPYFAWDQYNRQVRVDGGYPDDLNVYRGFRPAVRVA